MATLRIGFGATFRVVLQKVQSLDYVHDGAIFSVRFGGTFRTGLINGMVRGYNYGRV